MVIFKCEILPEIRRVEEGGGEKMATGGRGSVEKRQMLEMIMRRSVEERLWEGGRGRESRLMGGGRLKE